MSAIWNTLLVTPILNLLVVLYSLVGQNMGWAIVLLTLVIRGVLIPVMLPSLKTMQKQRDLQPELQKIKDRYKNDKQKQAEEQMKFFKEHGMNPTSGCLTQVVMILVLFALYGVISKFTNNLDIAVINQQIYFQQFKLAVDSVVSTGFYWLDLAKPDPIFALPVLAGLFQLVSSKMMQPYVETGEKLAKKTTDKSDDLAYNMQEQMLFLMPIMTVVITFKLPSGIALYLLVTTIFSIAQQYFVSGWGGMRPILNKLKLNGRSN